MAERLAERMAARMAKVARGSLRVLLVSVLSVLSLVALGYVALVATAAGRSFVRDFALAEANALFRGRLAARELSQLGLTGVSLRGVAVTDPSGARVIDAETLSIELSPLALLQGEIHIDRVAIDNARIELADLGTERGAIAAFALREPSPPEAHEPESVPPVVVVRAIELDAIAVSMELAELGVVGVKGLSARASFALRDVASVELSSLTTQLVREGEPAGRIDSTKARWVQAGDDSTLSLRGRLAQTQLAIDVRSRMQSDPDFARSPLEAKVVLDAIEADTLRALGQHQLAGSLKQPLRVTLKASGTPQALAADLQLGSAAGEVHVNATLLEHDRLELSVVSDGVTPGAVWAGAPDARIALDLTGNARLLGAPANIPFEVHLKSGSFGGSALPWVRAKARLEHAAVCDLILHAEGQGVTLDLSGDASAQRLSLKGTVRARDFELAGASAKELDADFTAAGTPTAPQVSIALRGTSLQYQDVALDQVALQARGGPHRYEVSLDASAPDGRVQLTAQVQLGERVVQLDASARGVLRSRPFDLQVRRARIGFDGAIDIERAVVEGLGQRAVVHGSYGAGARDRLVADAQLDFAALSDALDLEPRLRGRADVELRASGTVPRPQAALSVRARDVGLHEPARERPTFDAVLSATLDTKQGELSAEAEITSGRQLSLGAQLAARFDPRKTAWHRELLESNVEGTLALDALSTEWIEKWLLEPLPMRGNVLASATLTGTIEQPELALTTRVQLTHPERADMYELAVQARYAAASVELELTGHDEHGAWLQASAALEHPANTLEQFLAPGAALPHEATWKATLELSPRALGSLPIDAFTKQPLDPELSAITAGLSFKATHAPRAEPIASASLRATKPPRGTTTVRIGLEDHQCSDQQLELSVATELARGKLDARASVVSATQALFDAGASAEVVLEPALRGIGAPVVSEAGALVQLSEVDLAGLPRLCGLAQGRLSGRIDASALFSGDPRLSVQLEGKQIGFGAPQGFDLELRASATRAEAKVDIGLDHGDTRSTIAGAMPIRWQGSELELLSDQPMSARVELNRLPVMALLPPSFAISRASGYLSGSVIAAGTLDEPRLSGRIEPERVALTVTGLAQPLHGIDGRISFSNRRITVERLIAKDRDGSITLKGSAELAENNDVSVKLSIKADGFPLRQQGQIAGEVDAQIKVAAHMTEHRTRVEVTMEDASAWLFGGKLRRGISLDDHPDIRDPRAAEREVAEAQEESEIPPQPIEISINAEDSFWVRRDDFAVKLSTKLELRIDDGKVAATGPVQIHRGYLQLFGQPFDIDSKSKVDLTGGTPPDPMLDITAATLNRASGETITVNISGHASAPELKFLIDDVEANAGEAATAMFGGRGDRDDGSAEGEARSFVAGMMAGVMAMSARRELGDAMPILMIEPADDVSASRVRAGFELDKLVPGFLEGVIRGAYVEGIVAGSSEDEAASSGGVQTGVLLELYLPHNFVTSGQYGPGETWSVDVGWEP